jgi:methionine-rich copper-binding protein CopC
MLAASTAARAADLKVIDTWPAANAVIDSRSDGFIVRFNQPIDHVFSSIFVKRGDQTVETLKARLDSAPEVLFARAPSLPAGSYTLHWVVKTIQDQRIEQGDVPFTIGPPK